ncbi:YrvL family regulatory protein [Bacillus thuringiensis]
MRKAQIIKTILICTFIIAGILIGITFFEFLLLRLLGLQYQSFGSLATFFVIYLFLEVPLSIITDNIPKALKTVGITKSSKGLLSFILDIGRAYILIITIDYFMKTITISWQGALIFSLISGIIGWKLKRNDEEPPMIDSDEFKELERKINSKK